MRVIYHAHRYRRSHVRGNFVLGARPDTVTSDPLPETGWPSVEVWDEMVEACESYFDVLVLVGKYTSEAVRKAAQREAKKKLLASQIEPV